MRLSIYTFVKDGLYYDFHVVDMLKHHLPLADEIIVNEGFSKDGTYEAIKDLDPKIKVHRFEWDRSDPFTWHIKFKEQARRLCTGDWCLLLDCDEFIPDWQFPAIREFIQNTDKDLMSLKYVHFYGNYKVVHKDPLKHHWPLYKMTLHRNREDMEIWGDGSNVAIVGMKDRAMDPTTPFECHHFGFVRNPARLRQKWRTQSKMHAEKNPKWDKTPGVLFDLFPHRWDDEDFLEYMEIYEGPYIKAVLDNPSEFVRDDFSLLPILAKRKEQRIASKSH
jgi:glycosyltransferase involved in cell wall biosynthesis